MTRLIIKVIREPEGRYRAFCPELPGCDVYGRSQDDARRRLSLAISGYLASFNLAAPVDMEQVDQHLTQV